MTRQAFERRVTEALTTIPRRFRDAMSNIAIVVEDEPSDDLLEEMEIDPPDTLFGLYQGTPLTERGWAFGNALPDRILLFQGPHEREAEDEDELIVSIGETLIHEIGHYFGMSEEEIEEIEGKWPRRPETFGSTSREPLGREGARRSTYRLGRHLEIGRAGALITS